MPSIEVQTFFPPFLTKVLEPSIACRAQETLFRHWRFETWLEELFMVVFSMSHRWRYQKKEDSGRNIYMLILTFGTRDCGKSLFFLLFSPIVFSSRRCLVYSASGFNKGKDKLKTSFHLVWPQLVVDSDSAPWLREITLMIFSALEASAGSGVSVGTDPAMAVGYGSRWACRNETTDFSVVLVC